MKINKFKIFRIFNTSQQIFFLLSIFICIVFILITVISYLSVYLTFGDVPPSQDYTSEFISNSENGLPIFPYSAGIIIFFTYIISVLFFLILTPIFILIRYFFRETRKFKILFYIYLSINILIFILLFFDLDIISWYIYYILD